MVTLLVLLFVPAAAWAQQQQSYMDEPGIPAFTTSFPVEHGFINVPIGALHLEIPIASYNQRGKVQYNARLVYDSRFWTYDPANENLLFAWNPNGVSGYPQPFGVGWRLITGGESGNPSSSQQLFLQCTYNHQSMYKTKFSKYQYQEPDGTVHRFPSIILWQLNPNCAGTGNGTASALASDNSGFRMDVTNFVASAVYAPDGTKVYPAVQDTNGNFFTETFQQVPNVGYIDHVVDTLGREPVIASFLGDSGEPGVSRLLEPSGKPLSRNRNAGSDQSGDPVRHGGRLHRNSLGSAEHIFTGREFISVSIRFLWADHQHDPAYRRSSHVWIHQCDRS